MSSIMTMIFPLSIRAWLTMARERERERACLPANQLNERQQVVVRECEFALSLAQTNVSELRLFF